MSAFVSLETVVKENLNEVTEKMILVFLHHSCVSGFVSLETVVNENLNEIWRFRFNMEVQI